MKSMLEYYPWLKQKPKNQERQELKNALYRQWCKVFGHAQNINREFPQRAFAPHHSIGHFREGGLAMAAYLSSSHFSRIPLPSAQEAADVVNGLECDYRRALGDALTRETAVGIEATRAVITGSPYKGGLGFDPSMLHLDIPRSMTDAYARMGLSAAEILEMWQQQLRYIYEDIVQGRLKPQ